MSDTSEILGNLPRTRPQRRSDHRPRPVSDAAPDTEVAGAAHRMAREESRGASSASHGESGPDPVDVLTTAVRAADTDIAFTVRFDNNYNLPTLRLTNNSPT